MLDRMEQMMRSQRQFASHLAHDLRTPLTRLRGLLQADASHTDTAGRQLLDKAERECRSIISIFDALLRLSEIEAGRHPTAMAPLALDEVILDVAETMEPVIADAGSHLALAPAPGHGDGRSGAGAAIAGQSARQHRAAYPRRNAGQRGSGGGA
jgi:signal transduction histidine kinase